MPQPRLICRRLQQYQLSKQTSLQTLHTSLNSLVTVLVDIYIYAPPDSISRLFKLCPSWTWMDHRNPRKQIYTKFIHASGRSHPALSVLEQCSHAPSVAGEQDGELHLNKPTDHNEKFVVRTIFKFEASASLKLAIHLDFDTFPADLGFTSTHAIVLIARGCNAHDCHPPRGYRCVASGTGRTSHSSACPIYSLVFLVNTHRIQSAVPFPSSMFQLRTKLTTFPCLTVRSFC
ncbi:hypothetical protein C8R44DRAFT_96414 [Mycena epipterygia]|nr:hypothetical protein C8R44DRAFT_96414 [Mycena epipterygia]